MRPKKILLLYISEDSGHHSASLAIERALHRLDATVDTLNINSFNYTNPILEKVINKAYMGVVKRTPEIWDYLYDNPEVVRRTQRLREMIHRFNTGKLKTLLDKEFPPDAVLCTQAFPCGMIADYKKTFNLDMPLVGILTDYAPHSYWLYDNVDRYVVPSEEVGKRLIDNGIDPARVSPLGIPIDSKFKETLNRDALRAEMGLDKNCPTIFMMGGSQGLGPIKEVMRLLERPLLDLQIIVATGTNKRLHKRLIRISRRSRKKIVPLFNALNVHELMHISDIIITKPGGITTAEALAKGLPMLIVHPLPGQEAMNTRYLLDQGVALKAEGPQDAVTLVEELLFNRVKLRQMSEKAKLLSKPDSSIDIARLTLGLIES